MTMRGSEAAESGETPGAGLAVVPVGPSLAIARFFRARFAEEAEADPASPLGDRLVAARIRSWTLLAVVEIPSGELLGAIGREPDGRVTVAIPG